VKSFTIIIPAKDECESIGETLFQLDSSIERDIPMEIVVIDDYSNDNTSQIVNDSHLSRKTSCYRNQNSPGVGNAIRYGLTKAKGDIIAICMADSSDSATDINRSYKLINSNEFDCVFGSRFIPGGTIENYPKTKLMYNRVFNTFVKLISNNNYNDYTNIFKTYSSDSIKRIQPFKSSGFSIGLEMSLKAFKNNERIKVIPISWRQREKGESKLNISKQFKEYVKTLISNI
jgi:dolichol-phosphate mannosyltransferase